VPESAGDGSPACGLVQLGQMRRLLLRFLRLSSLPAPHQSLTVMRRGCLATDSGSAVRNCGGLPEMALYEMSLARSAAAAEPSR